MSGVEGQADSFPIAPSIVLITINNKFVESIITGHHVPRREWVVVGGGGRFIYQNMVLAVGYAVTGGVRGSCGGS